MAAPKKLVGLAIAGTGAAHFAVPAVFEPLSKVAFPTDTRKWIYRNGTTELVLGLAFAADKTRKAAVGGLGVYGAWLASRAIAAR